MSTDQNHLTKKQSYWLEQIKKAHASELTTSQYAKANDLNLQQLYQYKHILCKKGLLEAIDKTPRFQKLQIISVHSLAKPDLMNLYFPNGLRLEFSSTVSANMISALVSKIALLNAAS